MDCVRVVDQQLPLMSFSLWTEEVTEVECALRVRVNPVRASECVGIPRVMAVSSSYYSVWKDGARSRGHILSERLSSLILQVTCSTISEDSSLTCNKSGLPG